MNDNIWNRDLVKVRHTCVHNRLTIAKISNLEYRICNESLDVALHVYIYSLPKATTTVARPQVDVLVSRYSHKVRGVS